MRDNRTVWLSAGLAGVVVSVALAACGGHPSSVQAAAGTSSLKQQAVSATAQPAGSERYQTRLERRSGTVRVDPVPASYRPRISQDQALAAFTARNLVPATAAGQVADIRLGLYTDTEMNVAGPAVFLNRPAWVIRYDNVPDEAHPDASRVNILAFVDADSGQYLKTITDPVDAR